jgi:beta-glucosidase
VNNLKAQKPAFIAINFSNPWIISEIDNGNTNTILATFCTTTDALHDVVTGNYKPTGKMPFSTPVSVDAVTNQKEDVPGYLEGEGYALFNYDEGIGY